MWTNVVQKVLDEIIHYKDHWMSLLDLYRCEVDIRCLDLFPH